MSAPAAAAVSARLRARRGRRVRGGGGIGPLGRGCAVVIGVLVLVAIFAPLLAPVDPRTPDFLAPYQGPSAAHLLGTDNAGYDLLSRLMVGARTSLAGPLAVIIVSTVLAVVLALVAAWNGGLVDAAIARAMDVVFAFPGILLAILGAAVFQSGLTPAVIALAISYTPYLGRVIRAAAIRETSQAYVDALVIQGVGGVSICLRHVLRNLVPTIAAQATVSFGYAMVDLAALSYLGLGVQRPTPDWGLMVANGQQGIIKGFPEESLYAGALIVITVAAFNILGERLADRAAGIRA